MRPYVSVIIPAYNEEAFLPKCLNSLKKQKTSIPFEVIVVDNNSTDNTASIPKRFGYQVIRELKKGASSARNAGARHAKGTILVFIDADCIAFYDYIQNISDQFLHKNILDVLCGPCVIYDAGLFIRYCTDQLHYYSHYFSLIRFITRYQLFSSGNFAIKRNVYQKIGGFDESISNVIEAEDVELACRLNSYGYTILFLSSIKILTSFRRIIKNPIQTGIRRTYHMLKYLHQSKSQNSSVKTTPQKSFWQQERLYRSLLQHLR